MRNRNGITVLVLASAALLMAHVDARAVVTFDGNLTNSSQILSATNNPFFGAGNTQNLVGVNFNYGSATNGTINGVSFDNINFTGTNPPPGPYAVVSNGWGATLDVNAPWGGVDNTPRSQFTALGGADGGTLSTVANQIFYVGHAGCCHQTIDLNFGNLGANRNVHVQMIGGDQGWTGDLGVTANGAGVGTWTSVADGAVNTASLFSFDATTNGSGQLNLGMSIVASNFAGLGGIVITGQGNVAPPPTPPFSQFVLTNTAQISTDGDSIAALNFRYSSQPTVVGSIHGTAIQNIDWLGGAQALTNGGTITITGPGGNRSRVQSTAATISGPDEAVLEALANSINFLGANEQVTLDFAGLEAERDVLIQIVGGDNGTAFANWLGDLEVLINGGTVGVWDIVADDVTQTASLATLLGRTTASGDLQITLRQINQPPGQFAGIGGIFIRTVPAIPEPTTALLLAAGGAVLLGRHRRRAA